MTQKDTFYLTTPIYYVNDLPHIGHAYTTIAADVLARWHRPTGERVLFLTGTDEHGQKVARAAEAGGLDPQAWTDQIVERWKADLGRARHRLRRLHPHHRGAPRAAGAAPLAAAVRPGRRLPGQLRGPVLRGLRAVLQPRGAGRRQACPIHGTPVDTVREENYFFRLSKYADRLLEHYRDHPEFVRPETAPATRSSPSSSRGSRTSRSRGPASTGGCPSPGTQATSCTSGSTRSRTT